MGLHNSRPQLYPGDIIEFPRNKYFSHFGVFYGERDGVPYVAHLTCRDSDTKLLLFGRALNSAVKLDPLDVVGKKYKVNNYLDDKHPPRDFYSHIKPEIEDVMTKTITFDILFHNSEHQATLLRYGVKKSEQIEKVYAKVVPTWRQPFEKKRF
ncbi:phospholipase A and acyltransferase 2 [Pygocentrus nattereri]|uniref:LRAT domain-containing protein n=1 Tax=Pygocentrus nattereri TaxID=42514 RepID=A0AAR2ILJ3_PYGNA|nr:phospholipase A and acyltransferase 2 [Pygocentrus nattereri]